MRPTDTPQWFPVVQELLASHSYQPFNPLHMNIFVGRLSHAITELHLELLFGHFGQVDRATVVMDRSTGASKQFGFVEMHDPKAAQEAINKLNGAELEGARLVVKPADTNRWN